ncbi:TraR/DksA family transcriptional regulator [Ideonella livida]|uniref:TraR/DksA family transcriptional regulator n=1 Tax=Ideonella livida TaxID=2707176 RepID=A0A7C9TM58_9BURK|nr:TraR/DksA family transcriptional regulator [Ideonella livida]NDY92964.1 TraR/DksA family transcriptional regulator [Ideonella livida]
MTALPTSEQRAQLAQRLQARRLQLIEQRQAQLQGQDRVAYATELLLQDGDDAPQRDADREVALARADRERQELGHIEQALMRLDHPGFGLCTDCGEPIALARLQAEPWALRCVACESAREGWQPRHTL